ncbi:MAG: hypothetical protein ACREJC_09990, partial [Tepidisphaeraceae bacterium]
ILGLTACREDQFVVIPMDGSDAQGSEAARDNDAGASADADADAKADMDATLVDTGTDGGTCVNSGPVECQNVIDAYCGRYAPCCVQFPGNGSCAGWGANVSQCKSHWKVTGFDCNAAKFQKCSTSATACKNDIQTVSCTAIFQSVDPASFPSCATFFGQF